MFYRYVAPPSLYKRDKFCMYFIRAFLADLENHKHHPKTQLRIAIVTGLPPLTVAFHCNIDLIMEMLNF